jgi:hypothetical protein
MTHAEGRYTIGRVVRQEILDRLLELNHEWYAAEVKSGLHYKRGRKRHRSSQSAQPEHFRRFRSFRFKRFHSSDLLSSLSGEIAGMLGYIGMSVSRLAARLWCGIAAGLCRIFVLRGSLPLPSGQ